jgi:hypothetical protein
MKTRYRMPDAGCRMPDAGCRMPDAGCRMPDAGCRMPDAGKNSRLHRQFPYDRNARRVAEPPSAHKGRVAFCTARIVYLLRGQRSDGCMPDRVNVDGRGVYAPGGEEHPLADHALDNGPFMAKLVCAYVVATDDLQCFRDTEPALRKGLDFTRRDETGLVYNPPEAP